MMIEVFGIVFSILVIICLLTFLAYKYNMFNFQKIFWKRNKVKNNQNSFNKKREFINEIGGIQNILKIKINKKSLIIYIKDLNVIGYKLNKFNEKSLVISFKNELELEENFKFINFAIK